MLTLKTLLLENGPALSPPGSKASVFKLCYYTEFINYLFIVGILGDGLLYP